MSPQGEIRTAAVNGHAVVMVTEHEEDLGLNQTMLVHVEVSVCMQKQLLAILTVPNCGTFFKISNKIFKGFFLPCSNFQCMSFFLCRSL